MKSFLKKIANKFGYDILHLPTNPTEREKKDLFKRNNINEIFDVGANIGQYAERMRGGGFLGRIISFEPLPDAFRILQQKAQNDKNWTAVNTAVGNSEGEVMMNVSKNSYSSSILSILPIHLESAPEAEFVDNVSVKISKIDSLINNYSDESNLFVKIDTQGFERQVFEGCLQSLHKIKGFQMELSLLPLYQGETLIQEMITLLREYGYFLKLVESGYQSYKTNEIQQLEGYFFKS